MPTSSHKYVYSAFVTAVYDGDTVTMDIDLGMRTHIVGEKVRLLRINAPEVRGAEKQKGYQARDRLRELILGKEVVIRTLKDKKGKYGRYLADIWLGGVNINDQLVQEGYAVFKDY